MRPIVHHDAHCLKDALTVLSEQGRQASPLAGGTDLLVALRRADAPRTPLHVIDLSHITELAMILLHDDYISIGACVTHTRIEKHPDLRAIAPLLAQACSQIGSPQIRNRGTIGGNLCNASACADTIPPLLVLNASVVLQSIRGQRKVPLAEFITAPYETVLKPDELLTYITFPRPTANSGSSFVKLGRRNALSVSRMDVAVLLHVDDDDCIADPRVAAGSVAPVPQRFELVEKLLAGQVWNEELGLQAGALLAEEMIAISGRRWSTPYKEPVVSALLQRALKHALAGTQGIPPQPFEPQSALECPPGNAVSLASKKAGSGHQRMQTPQTDSETANASELIELTFVLNDRRVQTRVPENWTLLRLLREQLLLTGTKCGCEIGECGACTVIINGEAVNSCLVLAPQIQGRTLTTVEGLATKVDPHGEGLHPIQKAFLDNDAVACGFCTPGMLMSAKALLDRCPRPSRPEIEIALSGNLCRCTGYIPILAAVEQAARDLEESGDAQH